MKTSWHIGCAHFTKSTRPVSIYQDTMSSVNVLPQAGPSAVAVWRCPAVALVSRPQGRGQVGPDRRTHHCTTGVGKPCTVKHSFTDVPSQTVWDLSRTRISGARRIRSSNVCLSQASLSSSCPRQQAQVRAWQGDAPRGQAGLSALSHREAMLTNCHVARAPRARALSPAYHLLKGVFVQLVPSLRACQVHTSLQLRKLPEKTLPLGLSIRSHQGLVPMGAKTERDCWEEEKGACSLKVYVCVLVTTSRQTGGSRPHGRPVPAGVTCTGGSINTRPGKEWAFFLSWSHYITVTERTCLLGPHTVRSCSQVSHPALKLFETSMHRAQTGGPPFIRESPPSSPL